MENQKIKNKADDKHMVFSTYELPDSTKRMFNIDIKHAIGIHQIVGILKLKSSRYPVLQWEKTTIIRFLKEEIYLHGNTRILQTSDKAEDKYYDFAYAQFPELNVNGNQK